jgi:hypothetical protein
MKKLDEAGREAARADNRQSAHAATLLAHLAYIKNRLELAEQALDGAEGYYSRHADEETPAYLSWFYDLQVKLDTHLLRTDKAIAALQKLIACLEQTPSQKMELADSYHQLANWIGQDNPQKAQQYLQKALTTLDAITNAEPDLVLYKRNLCKISLANEYRIAQHPEQQRLIASETLPYFEKQVIYWTRALARADAGLAKLPDASVDRTSEYIKSQRARLLDARRSAAASISDRCSRAAALYCFLDRNQEAADSIRYAIRVVQRNPDVFKGSRVHLHLLDELCNYEYRLWWRMLARR